MRPCSGGPAGQASSPGFTSCLSVKAGAELRGVGEGSYRLRAEMNAGLF